MVQGVRLLEAAQLRREREAIRKQVERVLKNNEEVSEKLIQTLQDSGANMVVFKRLKKQLDELLHLEAVDVKELTEGAKKREEDMSGHLKRLR